MDIGPLEYVVLTLPDARLHETMAAELNALHAGGSVRVADLVVVTKDATGTLHLHEVCDLGDDLRAAYGPLIDELGGLLSVDDVERLTADLAPGTSAMVLLLEHAWVLAVTDLVRDAGGTVVAGGMVSHDALAWIVAELTAERQDA